MKFLCSCARESQRLSNFAELRTILCQTPSDCQRVYGASCVQLGRLRKSQDHVGYAGTLRRFLADTARTVHSIQRRTALIRIESERFGLARGRASGWASLSLLQDLRVEADLEAYPQTPAKLEDSQNSQDSRNAKCADSFHWT